MKFIAALLMSTAVAGPVFAEAPAAQQGAGSVTTPPTAGQPSEIEEITVTAQKRAENVQRVPISIIVVGAETLNDADIKAPLDLPRVVPNLEANKGPTTASVRLAIRGLGAYGNSAVEPSVGTFVDGIYIPRPGSLFGSFLDISAVEALRGPQGTLFGRNTSVGALNIRTEMPAKEYSGSLTSEVGTGNRYRLSGDLNMPVSERVTTRIAALVERFGGYYHNDLNGARLGGVNTAALRGTIKADLTDNLTWVVRADYAKLSGDGSLLFELLPNTLTPAGQARLNTLVGAGQYDLRPFDFRGNQLIHSGLYDLNTGVSSDLTWDVGGGFRVRLLDSVRDWENSQGDGDLSWLTLSLLNRDGKYHSVSNSHELQLISPQDLLNGKLDFVGGLFYFHEDYKIDFTENMGPDYCLIAVSAANRALCQSSPLVGAGRYFLDQSAKSAAAYEQVTFRIVPTLALTLGGRYTEDDKDGLFAQTRANPTFSIRAPENTPLEYKNDRFTYRSNLSWTPAADVLLFATYSTGYKSGGFNAGAGNVALTSAKRTFGPEEVKDYEAGFKTQFFDRTLTLNGTLYRMDVSGYQDRQIDSNAAVVVRNVGDIRQQGFELESTLRPDRRLSLNASVAYLHSEFTDYHGAPGLPAFGGTQDLTGKSANNSPRWSGAAAPEWRDTLGSNGLSWSFREDLSFTSSANLGQVTDGNPDTIQKGYALLGARLSLFGPSKRWSASVFAQNITDKGYCALDVYQIFDGPLGLRNHATGSTLVRCIAGPPRTIGASASLHF
jgi:iron complex outermembrane receptor protein